MKKYANTGKKFKEKLKRKKSRIEKQKLKESSWQLHRECKKFEKNWETKSLEREKENKKKERLEIARSKQE